MQDFRNDVKANALRIQVGERIKLQLGGGAVLESLCEYNASLDRLSSPVSKVFDCNTFFLIRLAATRKLTRDSWHFISVVLDHAKGLTFHVDGNFGYSESSLDHLVRKKKYLVPLIVNTRFMT